MLQTIGFNTGEAYLACLMLQDEAWINQCVTDSWTKKFNGCSLTAAAEAIGGSAGWIDDTDFSKWVTQAVTGINAKILTYELHSNEWTEALFLIEVSKALHDAAIDHQCCSDVTIQNEYVFCVSHKSDRERMGEIRSERALTWSLDRHERCAVALVRAMDLALSRETVDANAVSTFAPEIAMRLALMEGARPQVLVFLLKRYSEIKMPSKMLHMGCIAFDEHRFDAEEHELAQVSWHAVRSAPSSKVRSDFPWGLWLAWCIPSLADEWSVTLGVRADVDALLARDMTNFAYDWDEWNDKESSAAMSALVLLERLDIAAATMLGRLVTRKTL